MLQEIGLGTDRRCLARSIAASSQAGPRTCMTDRRPSAATMRFALRVPLWAITMRGEAAFPLSRAQRLEMLFAAANQGICAGPVWAIIALKRCEAHEPRDISWRDR